MDRQAMYRDIALRTGGDLYLGVVGPVRTGKSTFIQRFMEELVLPGVEDENERERARDEMPVSGAGKTIMTIQPSFVPNDAVSIRVKDGAQARVRLIDCVGYLIKDVMGLTEDGEARMVRTPWFEYDIPFEKAAQIGTRKVIEDHATLAVLMTTDGSVTEFPRSAYVEAEEKVARELMAAGKPFAVVVNTRDPESDAALHLRDALSQKYGAKALAMNVREMDAEDAESLLEALLFEFPLTEAYFRLPQWVGALPGDHPLVASLLDSAREAAATAAKVRDHEAIRAAFSQNENAADTRLAGIRLAEGGADYEVVLPKSLFYRVLGEESGTQVEDEEHLLRLMTEMTRAKRAYDRVAQALESVEETGYGLVAPAMSELKLEQPEIVRQGGRFGVRLKASAPSLHLIRVDTSAEVSPIVGTEKQSEELVNYLLSEFENDPSGIWETNIFGKPLSDMMREGLSGKLNRMPGDVQVKLREAVTKIVNEGNGGVICILL